MPTTTLEAAAIALNIAASLTNLNDIGIVRHSLPFSPSYNFGNGTGANQANEAFADIRTLTASSSENLDLAGVLLDAFGSAITFTKIKALVVMAAATNTNDVLVGGAASNGFITPFGDPTDIVKVKPGGLMVLVAPDANGYAVTAGTGDILKVANSAGGSSITYSIIAIGVAS
jgi:hypothetical protein